MSATDIKDISDAIVTIASGITATATFDGFAQIFDYMPEIDEIVEHGSPILIILPTSVESPITTTSENDRTYSYLCDIYVVDDDGQSKEDVEKQLKYTVGHLIQAIDDNWNAIGHKIEIQITNWDYNFTQGYRRASITVQVNKLVGIT